MLFLQKSVLETNIIDFCVSVLKKGRGTSYRFDEIFKWLEYLIIGPVVFRRDWRVRERAESSEFWKLSRVGEGKREFKIQRRVWKYIAKGIVGWLVGGKIYYRDRDLDIVAQMSPFKLTGLRGDKLPSPPVSVIIGTLAFLSFWNLTRFLHSALSLFRQTIY